MFKLLIPTIVACLPIFCNAQGSWNIGYIQVDSISKKHIGQVVRLDFKSINPWKSPDGKRYIRSYAGASDTGIITIDSSLFILAERRKIYVDHGSYKDQYLECINCKRELLFIYDAKILEVDQETIQFQLEIEIKKRDQILRKESKILAIDRSELDGVMYKLE